MKDLDMGLGCSGDSNEAIWSKKKSREHVCIDKHIMSIWFFLKQVIKSWRLSK